MDEANLLSLMDKDEVKEYTDRQDDESREDKLKVEKATKENSSTVPADSASAPEETKTKEKKTPSVPIETLVLLVLTGFAAIGQIRTQIIRRAKRKII